MIYINNLSSFGNTNAIISLQQANKELNKSISRLASGNKIIDPSDDVAGLALGNKLKSDLAAIEASLTNTSQAKSMIGIASDALTEVSGIITELKSLASQAASGAISDTQRANLDISFQSLIDQIDQIANGTNFNDIKLINGDLADSSIITTNTTQNSTQAQGTMEIVDPLADGEIISITIDGETVNFTGKTAGFTDPLIELDVATYVTTTDQATQIASQIATIRNYSGNDTDILNAKRILTKIDITDNENGQLVITAKSAGTRGNAINIASTQGAGDLTLDGVDATGAGQTLGNSGFVAIDGALASGTFSSGSTAFSGTATTIAVGNIGDTILNNIDTTTQANTGIDVSAISNNPDFIGSISGFTASYSSDEIVDITLSVGDYTYRANGISTNFSSDTVITFASQEDGGGFFQLQFNGGAGEASVKNQTDANIFAARLDAAFSGITFVQQRSITSFTAAGLVYPTGSTTASGDLSGASVGFQNSNFSNIKIQDVNVTHSASGDAVIELTINDQIYRSGFNADGSALSIGNSITSAEGTGATGAIGFVNISDPNNIVTFDYASATTLSLSTEAEAEGFEAAFKNAFGIGSTSNNNGAAFRVGQNTTDVINLTIPSVKTANIFVNSGGASQTLSITSQSNANNATTILQTAENLVNAAIATVGAIDSRFNYAKATLESSLTNIDSARGSYLDTDIIEESANLARISVILEAGYAALAQSIESKKSFLKLLNF